MTFTCKMVAIIKFWLLKENLRRPFNVVSIKYIVQT